jgi:hypothetical protein
MGATAALVSLTSLVLPSIDLQAGATSRPGTLTHGTAETCSVSPKLVPSCGDWWGAAVPNTGSNLSEVVADTEFETGRRLDIVHTYHRWAQDFPTVSEVALAKSGHILLINWQPTDEEDKPIAWQAIADGSQDQVIAAEAIRLKAMGTPVMISFSHEPEADIDTEGSASQYVAAYRRVHDLVVAAGATNVVWVWDIEGIATSHWFGLYQRFWPGTKYVDWIAWDPYNFASCRNRPWRSFDALVAPFYRWIERQPFAHRPLMLAEYGTIGNITGVHTKQGWYNGEASSLSAFPAIKSVVYFDYPSPPASCDWAPNSFPAAASFAALAKSQVFRATARLTPDAGPLGP